MANHNMSSRSLQTESARLLTAGFSIIPIRDLSTKAPGLSAWKSYQTQPASFGTAAQWFTANGTAAAPGVAIVCGTVSQGLTVLDFDVADDGTCLWDQWQHLVQDAVPSLFARLVIVRTPSGGRHVYFRCAQVRGNTKLAVSATGETLIETRGEGGYVLAPPSPGYTVQEGDLLQVGEISEDQRLLLLGAAACLSRASSTERAQVGSKYETAWDQYNHEQDSSRVAALLVSKGWQQVANRGALISFRRPGKAKGTSATLFCDGEIPIFYCFSSNAAPIPPEKGLSPFAVYAYLEHGGDFKAAARAQFKQQGRALNVVPAYRGPEPTAPAPAVEQPWAPAWVSHAALRAKEFPARRWAVPNLIPEGCTLLCGGPKVGKSWLLLDLAICVEFGSTFLKFAAPEQGEVAYIQLEDGEQLVAERVLRLAADGTERLRFEFHWPSLDRGGLEALDAFLRANPAVRLVMIDTLARVRPAGVPGKGMYEMDYAALKGLADLSHDRHVSIVVAHHTRKMASKDAMDLVSGSNGLGGAVDTVMVLERKRLEDVGILTIMSRLIEEHAYACKFNKEGPRWEIVGDADQVAESEQQEAVMEVLRDAGCALSPAKIAESIGVKNVNAVQKLLSRMEAGHKVVRVGWGKYSLTEEVSNTPGSDSDDSDSYDANDPGDPPCSHAVIDVSHMSHSSQNQNLSNTKDAPDPLPEDVMRVHCPSCGKQYTWRVSPHDETALICRHCGKDHPSWTLNAPLPSLPTTL